MNTIMTALLVLSANTVDEFNPVLPVGLLLAGLALATWALIRWKKRDQDAAMERFQDEQDRRERYIANARARLAKTAPTLLIPELKPMPTVRAPVAADRDTYVPMAYRNTNSSDDSSEDY